MSNLIRWNDPFAGLTSMHSQLDDLFNNFFDTNVPTINQTLPAMDVYSEDDKQLVAEVHVPGFNKDEIDVQVHNGMLEIKGEHTSKEEEKDKKSKRSYMVRESRESFYRRLALPKHADGDNVKADFNNGVLKVQIPFKELPKPKRIEISSGKK
jgi:HSP20 family protein